MDSVVIVAGGKGERMKNSIPKQFMLLNGLPILMHTIRRFYDYLNNMNIILVLPGEYLIYWNQLCSDYNFTIPHQFISGGETRSASVRQGLTLASKEGLVAIHDAVRPLVSIDLIRKLFEKARVAGNAIPIMSINDSVRYIANGENKSVDRQDYKTVQTPQVFKADFIKLAYSLNIDNTFTDDASFVESLNIKINTIEGEQSNIKITQNIDLVIAETILNVNS